MFDSMRRCRTLGAVVQLGYQSSGEVVFQLFGEVGNKALLV